MCTCVCVCAPVCVCVYSPTGVVIDGPGLAVAEPGNCLAPGTVP